MSEETRLRLGEGFPAEDLGPQSLKNVPHPVRVYRINAGVDAQSLDRRAPREAVSWPVRLWLGDTVVDGRMTDASMYGLCVAGIPAAPLVLGKSYRIDILIGEEPTTCVGTLRHVNDRVAGFETKEPLRVDLLHAQ